MENIDITVAHPDLNREQAREMANEVRRIFGGTTMVGQRIRGGPWHEGNFQGREDIRTWVNAYFTDYAPAPEEVA